MTIETFIANLADQFNETDISEIMAGTEFKKLDEWSSMIALSVIAMVDAEYGVQIKGGDIRDCSTVEELFNKVKSLKG